MSSATTEIAEEALESMLDSMTVSEEKPSDSDAPKEVEHKSPRKYKGKYQYESDRMAAWEEAQKDKVIVATGLKGTVKWYSILGRYGFIERADGKGDIFVHQSGISKSKAEKGYLRTLAEEEAVEFDVVQGKKGEEAVNVSGPDGTEVEGAKSFHILLRHPRRKEKGPRKVTLKTEDTENGEGEHDEKPKKALRRPNRRFTKKPKDNGEASEEVPEKEGSKKETRGRRRRANAGSPKEAEFTGADGDAAGNSLDALLA